MNQGACRSDSARKRRRFIRDGHAANRIYCVADKALSLSSQTRAMSDGVVFGARRRVVGLAFRASKQVEQNYGSMGIYGVVGRKWPSAPSLSLSPSSSSGLGPAMPMPVICILCVFVVGLLQPFSLSRETRAPRGDTRCCYCGRGLQPAVQHAMCSRGAFQRFFLSHRVYAG